MPCVGYVSRFKAIGWYYLNIWPKSFKCSHVTYNMSVTKFMKLIIENDKTIINENDIKDIIKNKITSWNVIDCLKQYKYDEYVGIEQ